MFFNRMTDEQKLVLFENTATNMGDSTMQIKHRYIRNFYLADPAYGKGVAEALGIDIESVNLDVKIPESREKWEEYIALDKDLNYPTDPAEPETAKDLPEEGRDTSPK